MIDLTAIQRAQDAVIVVAGLYGVMCLAAAVWMAWRLRR